MHIRKRSIKFLATFLIIVLGNRFADCLIEHSEYIPDKMKFEMEIFNFFDDIYEKCRESYKEAPKDLDLTWDWILKSTTEVYPRMENVLKSLKFEISCFYKAYLDAIDSSTREYSQLLSLKSVVQFLAVEYSSVFLQGYMAYTPEYPEVAGMFLHLAAYLAAFGANPHTGVLSLTDVHRILFTAERLDQVFPNAPNVYFTVDIKYGDFVDRIKNIIYSNYNPATKTLDTYPSDELELILELHSYSQRMNSLFQSVIFAVNPEIPGSQRIDSFDNEKLWQEVLQSVKIRDLIESIYKPSQASSSSHAGQEVTDENKKGNSSASGASSGGSTVIKLLREIEKLKILIDKPEMADDEDVMADIVRGFNGSATLLPQLITVNVLRKFLVFTQERGSEMGEKYLANGKKLTTFISELPLNYH